MASSNLFLRVASAVVLLPLVVAMVLWRERLGFAGLVLAATVLALREFANLGLRQRPAAEHAVLVGGGTLLASALYAWPQHGLAAVLATVLLALAAQLGFARDIASAGNRLGMTLAGILYVSTTMVALPLVQRDVLHGERWVLLAMAATFASDTGAYFLGRAIGRHKLAPTISPGKTWEGVLGGLVGALLATFAARATFFPQLTVADSLIVGLATSVLAPAGDLVESLLKRSAGVKDSGTLIPGHGGMLDRVDALLFVGAFVFLYTTQIR